jgi:DNA-directed RNA polymerase sigma subunit (sigma70/sigma32)
MSYNDIKQKILELGVQSRCQLSNRNYNLFVAAKEKGVLDLMFPLQKTKNERELKWSLLKAFLEATKKHGIQKVMGGLSGIEVRVMREVVLRKSALSIADFSKKHDVGRQSVVKIMKTITKTLKGTKPVPDRMKKLIEELDEEKFTELKLLLSEQELLIMKRRALALKRTTLEEIAGSLGITREGVRQIEKRLLKKIERWRSGRRIRKKGKLVGRIIQLIQDRLDKGETLEQIKNNVGLNEVERKVLDIYVLSDEKLTQKEVGEKIGKTQLQVPNIIKMIEKKLLGLKRQKGPWKKRGPKEGQSVKRIKELIQERLSSGETLDQIKKSLGLNNMEGKILDVYVLPADRITVEEAAQRLDVSIFTITNAVRKIKNKLNVSKKRRELKERMELAGGVGSIIKRARELSSEGLDDESIALAIADEISKK